MGSKLGFVCTEDWEVADVHWCYSPSPQYCWIWSKTLQLALSHSRVTFPRQTPVGSKRCSYFSWLWSPIAKLGRRISISLHLSRHSTPSWLGWICVCVCVCVSHSGKVVLGDNKKQTDQAMNSKAVSSVPLCMASASVPASRCLPWLLSVTEFDLRVIQWNLSSNLILNMVFLSQQ